MIANYILLLPKFSIKLVETFILFNISLVKYKKIKRVEVILFHHVRINLFSKDKKCAIVLIQMEL